MSDLGMPYLLELNDVEKCAELCSRLGLHFVELNLSFPSCGLEALSSEKLNALSAQYGIDFTMHMDEEADPFSFNPLVREAWLQTFEKALQLCMDAHIPVLNMHMPRGVYITLPSGKVYMREAYRAEYLQAVDAFIALVLNYVKEKELLICVENTSGFLPVEREALEKMLAHPVFNLTLDIGHCHAAGNQDEPFFLLHANRLKHMHVHDAQGKRDHLPFGEGEIDLAARLSMAHRQNARILVEVKTVEALQKSILWYNTFVSDNEIRRIL